MEAMLEKLELSKDTSKLLNQFIKKVHLNRGKQYQILLETGESVTIAIDSKGRTEDDDISDEEFCKASQYFSENLNDEVAQNSHLKDLLKEGYVATKEDREELNKDWDIVTVEKWE